MNIERLLQLHMAALAVLGAIVLGFGIGSTTATVVMAAAAVASLWLTDIKGSFQLRHRAIDFAAAVAMIIAMIRLSMLGEYDSLRHFIHTYGANQLHVLARLLLFLHLLVLFQKKTNRVYWRLMLLSFLEVVASAGLNLEFEFGLLLMAYAVLAFVTAALFFQYRCSESLRAAASDIPQIEEGNAASPIAYQCVAEGYLARRLPVGKYVRHVSVMAIATMTFTAVFFCSVPRSAIPYTPGSAGRQTGLTRDVSLDEVGPLLISDEIVLRVTLQDYETRRPVTLASDPYWRGIVLDEYASGGVSARWLSLGSGYSSLFRPDKATSTRGLVRQEVIAEPSDRPELFSAFPMLRTDETRRDVRVTITTSQLTRLTARRSDLDKQHRYVVATSAFRNGRQVEAIPCWPRDVPEVSRQRLAEDRALLAELDSEEYPNLAAVASQIVANDVQPDDGPYTVAKALENHFLTSGLYVYSLDNTEVRDFQMDPLEDFIANHHSGHCEYYASALALMLRSQGIPSRLVIGFRGGEFNSVGNFYLLRELHTHAWVEAFLEPDQLPPRMASDETLREEGAWLRLDPTPADVDLSSASLVNESLDFAQALWDDYVLGLDSQRQQSLLAPLLAGATMLYQLGYSRALTLNAAQWLAARETLVGVLFVVLLLSAGVVVFVRLLLRRRAARKSTSRRGRRETPEARFYRELERILARQGMRRKATQTPREFAQQAAKTLVNREAPSLVTEAPCRIVDAYYRVRYGNEPLDPAQQANVRSDLDRLASALG